MTQIRPEKLPWIEEFFPNDLGSGHRWSWLVEASGPTKRNLLWVHNCKNGKPAVCWIDLASGTMHKLISDDPLHIEPSILCPVGCGDHGWIRDDKWVTA